MNNESGPPSALWRSFVVPLCLVSMLGLAACDGDDDTSTTDCIRDLSGQCADASDLKDLADAIDNAREALDNRGSAGAYREEIVARFEPNGAIDDLRVPSGLVDDLDHVATRTSSAEEFARFLTGLCHAIPYC